MQTISARDFHEWAASVGVGIDPQYPQSGCLRLLPRGGHARFWTMPLNPEDWPSFSDSLLEGFDEWSAVVLWPRSGV
jgi:hypothetical protein